MSSSMLEPRENILGRTWEAEPDQELVRSRICAEW